MNGRDIVDSTADTAYAVDGKGRILAWNEAAEKTFGYTGKEVLGCRCWEVLDGRDMFGNRYCGESCPLRGMALTGEPLNRSQLHLKNSLGTRLHVEMSLLVVSGSTRHDREIVHLLRDPSLVEKHRFGQKANGLINGNGNGKLNGASNGHMHLSERQHEVLALLAEGQSTKEMAERLFLSPATVRHHVQEVLRRLKVHTRLEAVALSRRTGLI